MNESHQVLFGKRFSQKTDGAITQGLGFGGLIFVGGDEDQGNNPAGMFHVILDIKAGHVWHFNIQHHTIYRLRLGQVRQQRLPG